MNWIAMVNAELDRDYPEVAERAKEIVRGWGSQYPFGDMPFDYAAMNAAEDAECPIPCEHNWQYRLRTGEPGGGSYHRCSRCAQILHICSACGGSTN